jgi:rhodanese-related sulfurtransferase
MSTIITLNELRERISGDKGLILIEALPEKYYKDGHIPGAIQIPHDAEEEIIRARVQDQNAEIVVYCANAACKNSSILAQRLEDLGYPRVKEYHEGKAEWKAAGLPLQG